MNGAPSRRLKLHEAHALLGLGDIHPGGPAATGFLLSELDKVAPRRVLEVGPGIGRTTGRLLERGWSVTVVEPNAVMRRVLEARLPIRAYPHSFETFEDPEPYDAVIGESVFYRFDLEQAFARVHRLLRPGGVLALNDMVWTEAAQPERVAAVAAETERVFGIPATSAEPLTWACWKRMLGVAGFVEVAAERIGPVRAPPGQRRTMLLNGIRHPIALARTFWYARTSRGGNIPRDWLESWMSVWRRA